MIRNWIQDSKELLNLYKLFRLIYPLLFLESMIKYNVWDIIFVDSPAWDVSITTDHPTFYNYCALLSLSANIVLCSVHSFASERRVFVLDHFEMCLTLFNFVVGSYRSQATRSWLWILAVSCNVCIVLLINNYVEHWYELSSLLLFRCRLLCLYLL